MPWSCGSGIRAVDMITDDLARYPEDVAYAHKFVDKLKAGLEERYADPDQTLRDFHSKMHGLLEARFEICLLYTSPSPRDQRGSRMPSSA